VLIGGCIPTIRTLRRFVSTLVIRKAHSGLKLKQLPGAARLGMNISTSSTSTYLSQYTVQAFSKYRNRFHTSFHLNTISTMAGPVLNFTVFTKSIYHALRAIALATFPPAFLVLLIQGILSETVNPAIGILPLFFSSAFSALLLANEKKCGCQASGLNGTPIHLVFDLVLSIGLLVCLILAWASMGAGYADRGFVIMGTYGTNFMLCNL
jgi:hypothetical protein